ncbi:glycosyltransferase [Cryomorpha ignava]|uniref:Glycosyltransferase n=1 Tax=Cryomorpha ignava TaxID=101383 RepID=A0A7K3WUJ7_9FLAO|nr:glycosyltransferase [Cryomorpha ignava]NEN25330.1 glycosyltransferase [Cryomorpha ignava]
MKIVVILSRVPYPLEKGDKLRAYHQLKVLHEKHEIILCCLSDSPVHPDAEKALREISSSFHIFKLKRWRIILNLFYGLFSRKPMQVHYFYQRKIHNAIKAVIEKENPDHIYCQLIRTAEYAKHEYNIRKTLDYQDAFSKGVERREQKASWPLREIFSMERRRLIAYENIIFEYFEGKTIISAEDRRFIYHPERQDIAVVTNGIDTAFFTPEYKKPKSYDLVFTGNMSYPPNIETAEYIVNEILPKLKEFKPDITLLLAGSSPHKRVLQLANVNGVEVSGWLDDIRDAYAKGCIFLAPMQIGTGLQNKLLEAMAMELPCVTSHLANRSLKAENMKELLVGENVDSYVKLIIRLLESDQERLDLGAAGRIFVQKHFSWEQSVGFLEGLMVAE